MTGRRGPDRRRFLRLGVGAAIPVAGAGCAALPLDDGDERELRSISYGETKAGFVATGDGIDPVFEHAAEPVSFEGTAGDGVAITMTATGSGSMDPYAVLEDPSGPVLTGPTGRRADAVVVETPLPASGTYTIWASTEDRLGDGPYELTLERTVDAADRPDRPDLRAVGYGETASGYVDALDGADPEYGDLAEPVAFDGRSGDGVAVTMAVSDADAEPYPVLAGPGGGPVAETADDPDGSTTVTATLPATGSLHRVGRVLVGYLDGGHADGTFNTPAFVPPAMLPTVGGVIDRRILVNYRIDPAALADALPDPFEPRTVDGRGVGGVCLIRLTGMGPAGLPGGLASENAAHRFAVEWDDGGERRVGVYVPRRDTSSLLNAALGGRLFAGRYHRAAFDVREDGDRFEVSVESRDGAVEMRVAAARADDLPADSVFDSVGAASSFFERASLGYSPDGAGDFEGVELATEEWAVSPLSVEEGRASYFEDHDRFPDDAVALDCALLMEDVDHEWRRGESLCAPATTDGQ